MNYTKSLESRCLSLSNAWTSTTSGHFLKTSLKRPSYQCFFGVKANISPYPKPKFSSRILGSHSYHLLLNDTTLIHQEFMLLQRPTFRLRSLSLSHQIS